MSHVGKLPLGYALGHANIANTTTDFALNIFMGPRLTRLGKHHSVIYEL